MNNKIKCLEKEAASAFVQMYWKGTYAPMYGDETVYGPLTYEQHLLHMVYTANANYIAVLRATKIPSKELKFSALPRTNMKYARNSLAKIGPVKNKFGDTLRPIPDFTEIEGFEIKGTTYMVDIIAAQFEKGCMDAAYAAFHSCRLNEKFRYYLAENSKAVGKPHDFYKALRFIEGDKAKAVKGHFDLETETTVYNTDYNTMKDYTETLLCANSEAFNCEPGKVRKFIVMPNPFHTHKEDSYILAKELEKLESASDESLIVRCKRNELPDGSFEYAPWGMMSLKELKDGVEFNEFEPNPYDVANAYNSDIRDVSLFIHPEYLQDTPDIEEYHNASLYQDTERLQVYAVTDYEADSAALDKVWTTFEEFYDKPKQTYVPAGKVKSDSIARATTSVYRYEELDEEIELMKAWDAFVKEHPEAEALRDDLDVDKCPECGEKIRYKGKFCPRCQGEIPQDNITVDFGMPSVENLLGYDPETGALVTTFSADYHPESDDEDYYGDGNVTLY